ncbi:putative peptidase [Symmachiella dynata]|uniref:Putative peptidase n=1 Tax=Symmachiella dynata TaxID=2527995 RepID=A0A517ZVV6_9PLAN|nr:Xaa-Pro peptidase family protein [Symmachiella dynata]QDU46624.1 putative peptidase [Symmachiella dynata]
MLTEAGCLARRARLWASVPESVEWLLVADPRHVYYLSNFLVNPYSFSGGERGLLLLERGGTATLCADNFTVRSAAGEHFVDRVIEETWYNHQHAVINRDHALFKALEAIDGHILGRNGAVEAEWLPLAAWEVLSPDRERHSVQERIADAVGSGRPAIDLGSVLRRLRRQKEPDELELMRSAIRAGEAGHARAREIVRAGISDFDVYREIHAAAMEAAGRPVILYGDFRVTNAQQFKAGGLPTGEILKDGDLMLMDFSVVIDGYRGDFTNVLSVGSPSDEQTMLMELCQAAMQSGEKALKAGAAAKDVHAATERPLKESGYGDTFNHHAGHGIGLAHPEPPILVPQSEDILVAGDVVTLEPGLYVEGIGGIRIEHNYLITETGYEQLSNHLISLA